MTFARPRYGKLSFIAAYGIWWRYRRIRENAFRFRDRWRQTYSRGGKVLPLARCLFSIDRPHFEAPRDQIHGLSEMYLAHCFDLLGSGWVRVRHGMSCRGLEGRRFDMGNPVTTDREGRWLEGRVSPANLEVARRLWGLVDEGYEPVDWHLDFKSGYRWSPTLWYRDVPVAPKEGADIKVPWELSRMQHLPILAFAYTISRGGVTGFQEPETYLREFRNQVLDFIASNPPRFGVNWHTTMEVGIRVANWLIAYDLYTSAGASFDPEFEEVFARGIYDHARHIADNLEWFPHLRTNHYLCNLAGLLFGAAYLPRSPETNGWLSFAFREMVKEMAVQFHPEGSNFEASTSYHRLSAETVVYATALVLGLPRDKREMLERCRPWNRIGFPRPESGPPTFIVPPGSDRPHPFPGCYLERLERMAEFTMTLTKPNGRVAQIGDNDSGRFLRLQPGHQPMTVKEAKRRFSNLEGYSELPDSDTYWWEDPLDHRHLVSAISGLLPQPRFEAFSGNHRMDAVVVRALGAGATIASGFPGGKGKRRELEDVGSGKEWESVLGILQGVSVTRKISIPWKQPAASPGVGIHRRSFPAFGIYVFRADGFFLSIRCGSKGQNGVGGHAHNDQLAVEINVGGEDLVADPGTYLYTPLPFRRNAYRSVMAHFAPRSGEQEPGEIGRDLFALGDTAQAICHYFGEHGFIGSHRGFQRTVYRVIEITEDGVTLTDYDDGIPRGTGEGGPEPAGWIPPSDLPPFSPGYGILCREPGARNL